MDANMLGHDRDHNVLKALFHDIISDGTDKVLPEEVILMILANLPLKELGNLRLVNRKVNKLIVNGVWKSKNSVSVFLYKKSKKYMPPCDDWYGFNNLNVARRVLQQRHPSLKQLVVQSVFGRGEKPLTPELIASQRNLADLSLKNLALSQPILQAISESLHGLKSINFNLCQFDGDGLALLGRQLEKLTLEMCNQVKMSFVMDALNVFVNRNQQLSTFKIMRRYGDNSSDFKILTYVLENFPEMKHFNCECMPISNVKMTKMVATGLESLVLKELRMSKGACDVLYAKLFESPLANLKKLHIDIPANNFTPELLKRVAATSPNLEDIYLNLSSNFSNYIDTFLVMPSLKWLKVYGVAITTEHVMQLVGRQPYLWHLTLHSFHGEDRDKRGYMLWSDRDNCSLFQQLCKLFAEQKRDQVLELMLPMKPPNAEEKQKAVAERSRHCLDIPVDYGNYFQKLFPHNAVLNIYRP